MTEYARKIRLFDAVMLVMGGIIGSGIFLNPAIVAQRVDAAGLAVGVWAAGGVIALAGAFVFAELGARYPHAGGGYVYMREALHPLVGFLYGWTLLLVISTGAIAAVAVTFARYTADLFGWDADIVQPLAVGAIVVLSLVNYVGVKPGAITQDIFTVLKIAALGVLIVVGLFVVLPAGQTDPTPAAGTGHGITAFGAALIPVLFAYGGWQQTNYVAEEIVDAPRTLPRALVLGVIGVVALYVLANVAYVRWLGVGGLAASLAPAADVMRAAIGDGGATLIGTGIALSTFGFTNLVILVTPRVYQAMAADGVFFRRVAGLHPRYRTPSVAILLQAALAILLTLTGTYGQLLDYVVFGDWIFFGLAGACLFVFRRRDRTADREPPAFLAPLFPWLPGLFVAAAAFAVVSSVRSNPGNALVGAGLIALGVPVFAAWTRARARGRRG